MACYISLRRFTSPSSPIFLLRNLTPSSSTRSFTSHLLPDDDRHRRRDSPFYRTPCVVDPFSGTRKIGQLMQMMDQFTDNMLLSGRRGWDVREDDDGIYMKMEMPGLGKEQVKVSLEHNTLVIKGECEGDEEERRRYSSRIDLPNKIYRVEDIKAEMKNGVLKVVVPKLKEDERADVFHVQVE